MEEMIQALADELNEKATVDLIENGNLLTLKVSWGNEYRKLVLTLDDDFDSIATFATKTLNEINETNV